MPASLPVTRGGVVLARDADVVYVYDGSLMGFYCCVHESVYAHEIPAAIWSEDEAQPTFFAVKTIEADEGKARRVRASILEKISPAALELVENVFMSCLAEKELHTLRFLLMGYTCGSSAMEMLSHECVNRLLAAERHLLGERHLLLGFVRFTDYGGLLAAQITPKNFVLPYLVRHFVNRYPNEDFVIYDKAHGHALVYKDKRPQIIAVDHIAFNEPGEGERQYRELWKQFYRTVAIEGRTNHKCRRTHMPKRYWPNMVEMEDYL